MTISLIAVLYATDLHLSSSFALSSLKRMAPESTVFFVYVHVYLYVHV